MDDLKVAEGTTQEREAPPVAPTLPGVAPEARARPVLPAGWAWFAGLVGPVVTMICIAVEPAPADPDAAIPVLDSLLFAGLLATFALAATTAVRREVRALTWAAAASAVTVALSVSCPTSGHHTDVGAWWYAQMAVSCAALVTATLARSRFRVSP